MPRLSFTRAFFETMSGLTTTGSTVLTGLDHAAAVAQLLARTRCTGSAAWRSSSWHSPCCRCWAWAACSCTRAETPGPVKDEQPRAAHHRDRQARCGSCTRCSPSPASWRCKVCGMSWFDAICHAFSAVGLGGFSTHDASIAYFNSPAIELVLMVLMLVASLNFARHFVALRRLSLETYPHDPEVRAILVVLAPERGGHRGAAHRARRVPATSCSRCATRPSTSCRRPPPAGSPARTTRAGRCSRPFWMLFLSCIVCSTGSTGGGIKMFRTLLLARQAGRELKLLVHPRGHGAGAHRRAAGSRRRRPVGAGLHLPVLHDGGAADLRACCSPASTSTPPSARWSPPSTTPRTASGRRARRTTCTR